MNQREETTGRFTPFWPLCLMAASLAVFLGWQVFMAVRQYIALQRVADQQTLLTGQAAQAETKLQAMTMDLLELAKTDADAKAIVVKYKIKFNPAAPSTLPIEAALPELRPKKGAGAATKLPTEASGAGEL